MSGAQKFFLALAILFILYVVSKLGKTEAAVVPTAPITPDDAIVIETPEDTTTIAAPTPSEKTNVTIATPEATTTVAVDGKQATVPTPQEVSTIQVATPNKVSAITVPTPALISTIAVQVPVELTLDQCNALQKGPYPSECFNHWWKTVGCTTDVSKVSAGSSVGGKSEEKSWWNGISVKGIVDDMKAWASMKDDSHAQGCYGVTAAQKWPPQPPLQYTFQFTAPTSLPMNGNATIFATPGPWALGNIHAIINSSAGPGGIVFAVNGVGNINTPLKLPLDGKEHILTVAFDPNTKVVAIVLDEDAFVTQSLLVFTSTDMFTQKMSMLNVGFWSEDPSRRLNIPIRMI